MTPEAVLTFWSILRRFENQPPPAIRAPERFQVWSESQEPGAGFPEHDLEELVAAGYLTPGKHKKFSEKGQRIAKQHVNPRTRHKFLRYVIFDELRSARHENPTASLHTDFKEDAFQDWGVTQDEVERAQLELANVGLFKLCGMNGSHADSYKLTPLGERACTHEHLIESTIEGTTPQHAGGVTQHFNISHAQQVNAGHTVHVDQGDLTFGSAVPDSQQQELSGLIRELRAELASVSSEAEREDAESAIAKVTSELAKSPPDQSRLRRWVEMLGDVAKPYANLLQIVTAIISLLRASQLIP